MKLRDRLAAFQIHARALVFKMKVDALALLGPIEKQAVQTGPRD